MADFGHKWGKGFGKRAAHSHPIFLAVIPARTCPLWINEIPLEHARSAKEINEFSRRVATEWRSTATR